MLRLLCWKVYRRFMTAPATKSHNNIIYINPHSPKNATLAGLVSTKLKLCVIYPNDVKHPHSKALDANFGSNLNKNGDNATLANSIRAEVAAEGVRSSFMIAPNGKFVPYKIDANANMSRGPIQE